MKKNVTYVDAAKFETIVKESGLTYAAQAGFVKVSGAKGRNVYVAATKRVGRVDLSGFTVTPDQVPGIADLGELAFGNVKQQLDFSQPEEAILANFKALLTHMATLPAVEKAQRAASTPKAPVAQGWSQDIPKAPSAEELKAQRIAMMKASQDKKAAKKAAKPSASSPAA